MSYKTYITDALVCGARASNTSDKSFLLFTREAGMLYASAKSVREERSKQRYALQEFSRVRVTLIRGKSGWKIAGTEPYGSVYDKTTRDGRIYVHTLVRLVRTYVRGEVADPLFYDMVMEYLALPESELTGTSATVAMSRILAHLGYVPIHEEIAHIFENPFYEVHSALTETEHDALKILIAQAFKESHLS